MGTWAGLKGLEMTEQPETCIPAGGRWEDCQAQSQCFPRHCQEGMGFIVKTGVDISGENGYVCTGIATHCKSSKTRDDGRDTVRGRKGKSCGDAMGTKNF